MAEEHSYTNRQLSERFEADEKINLLDIVSTIRRRWAWFGLTFTVVLGGVIAGTLLQTPIFQATGRLLIKSDTQASDLLGLAEKFGALDAASSQSNPVETEIQVLLSPPLLQTVIDDLDLRDADNLPLDVEEFGEELEANEVRGTDVIELKYRDSDPQVSAAVINQLMDVYQQHNLKVNRSQSVAARQFISQQIPRSDGKRREAQRQLKEFKQRYQIVEPTEEATVAIEELGELQGQIIATRADLEDVQEREIQLRKQLGGTSSSKAIASTSISGSQRLQEGIRALEEAQDELAAAEEVLTPNHPDLLNLQEKVASLSGNLQTRLSRSTTVVSGAEVNEAGQTVGSELINELVRAETSADGLRQRLADLEKSYQVQVASTLQYPELEEQFRQLSLDVEVATLAYTSLYESLQKALIAENQNIGNVSILHQASVPKEPISPRVLLNLLMGGVLGILLGTGLSLLVDARDLRLRTLEDVRRVYDYALLGAVPDFSETIGADANARANSLFVRDQPRSMISETYRMVNTNLQFSSSDNLQVVVISSGMPGEGKSSTLANIALAMAELGNRVILIDADMRLPSQHQVWELPNRKGLSHVLVDQNESFDRLPVIAENEGLDILPAGALPPNPTSLLSSQRFSALIKHLRERYDHVLIDAPPITVASDALLISQVVDGLLLVARPGKLNRAAANVAANMIRQAQVNILGVIGNAIRSKDETNGTQYYQQEYYGKESLAEETGLTSTSVPQRLSEKAASIIGLSK